VRIIVRASVIAFLFYLLLLLIGFLLLYIDLYAEPSIIPNMGAFLLIALFLYIILLIIWFIFSKNKSFKKLIYDAIPFLFAGIILYFWFKAHGWESLLSDFWLENPELSNLSAMLEYIKALVKTVMLSSITIIFWLYFKKKNKE